MSLSLLNETDEQKLRLNLKDLTSRRTAFAEVVRLYSQPLYSQIRRLVLNHTDANDILQEVFLKAWKALDSYRGEAKIYTWLYQIAYHESLTFLRTQQRRGLYKVEVTEENQTLFDNLIADPYFDEDEIEILFQKAIAKLPPKQKQVFLLRYYDELPYSEIALLMKSSEGSLKASFHHALKKIEKELTQ